MIRVIKQTSGKLILWRLIRFDSSTGNGYYYDIEYYNYKECSTWQHVKFHKFYIEAIQEFNNLIVRHIRMFNLLILDNNYLTNNVRAITSEDI